MNASTHRTYLVYAKINEFFFFFKQKTAYEMRISDWSSDVCSSDLKDDEQGRGQQHEAIFLVPDQRVEQQVDHRHPCKDRITLRAQPGEQQKRYQCEVPIETEQGEITGDR